MHRLQRHLRGILVALTALALSAGVALAARPSGVPPAPAADGLQRASEAAGKTVPVTVDPPAAQPQQPTATEETSDEDTGDEDAAEAPGSNDAIDPSSDRPQNHGWFVSQAAQADTPAEFANHGAYVSSIAKGDDGKPDAATSGAGATTSATARDKGAATSAAAKQKGAATSAAAKGQGASDSHGH